MIVVPLGKRVEKRFLATVRQVFGGAGGVIDCHPEDSRLVLRLRGDLAAFEALWEILRQPGDGGLLDFDDSSGRR